MEAEKMVHFGGVKTPVGVIGTGDYARALAKRLARCDYRVLCGSRYPQTRVLAQRDPELATLDVSVVAIAQALDDAEVIFLAVHPEHMEAVLRNHAASLNGKVLVDVSNPKLVTGSSQAERLQNRYPSAVVVKAFNTISAYAIENDVDAREKPVYIAGNYHLGNDKVARIAANLGFKPVIRGGLNRAYDLEAMQGELFGDWAPALLISIPFFIFWFVYGVVRYHTQQDRPWSQLPMHILNKVLACCALTYLALCFLPGCLASVLQLVRGTKHLAFPVWLDMWLRCRKQLGLIALYCAATHCVLSVAHLSPPYFKKWFDVQETIIPANQTTDIAVPIETTMNWRGETAIGLGVMAFSTMSILGISSLPSVSATMNWRQWRFVQTYLGYFTLAVATAHVTMKGSYLWLETPFIDTVQGMSFLSLVIPYLTMAFRFLLLLPPCSIYLYKIRRGWERGQNKYRKQQEVIRMEENGYHNRIPQQTPAQPGVATPSYAIVNKGEGHQNGGLANQNGGLANQNGGFTARAGTSNGAYEDVE